jgi:hypothetical protein
MRRLARRTMVVALAAGFTVVLAASAAKAQSIGTHTTLTTDSQQIGDREVTTYSAEVLGDDDSPATGIVTLMTETGVWPLGSSIPQAKLRS